MGYIASQIHEVAQTLGIPIITYDQERSSDLHKTISVAFSLRRTSTRYWEQLNVFTAMHDVEGWKKIDGLLGNGKVLLFFDETDEKLVFEFDSAVDLVELLYNSIGFVFYAAPVDLSEFICFNDHDMLLVFKASDQPFASVAPF